MIGFLNFCPIASHKGLLIGKAIERCLLDWGISKVFIITVDNASSNDVGMKYLQNRLKSWKGSVLNSDFLQMRFCVHILSLIVKEGLKDIEDSIFRIRSAMGYLRSSPTRLQRFKECVEQEKIEQKNLLVLDVETRWNFTYLMLDVAIKFQKAFELLEIQDIKYRDKLTRGEKSWGLPMPSDWEYARYLLSFLKVFYDATLRVLGSLFVIGNANARDLCHWNADFNMV
ncbi:zinc finger BED domain-containing protein RICESLEEPER 2-like [Pistacia vera]|uniref:zinc finger BED domain-containing protein RICESLEEPER 2-like n=1 Tax=Pistacia vera TaxID=55513 RepID=UPI001263B2EE|nr:zinc finger BED domain-containing protein RICESLEEPER 2-like [Pistacia vera]